MQTDTLFYELFKADPQSLFELVDLDINLTLAILEKAQTL